MIKNYTWIEEKQIHLWSPNIHKENINHFEAKQTKKVFHLSWLFLRCVDSLRVN